MALPGQPQLREQLSALQSKQMEQCLRQDFGLLQCKVQPQELVKGFWVQRKEELIGALLEAYTAAHTVAVLRKYILDELPGVALPDNLTTPLLQVLHLMCWKENMCPGVQSLGYEMFKRQLCTAPTVQPSAHPFQQKLLPKNDPCVVCGTNL